MALAAAGVQAAGDAAAGKEKSVTCLACHAKAHGKPFDYEASLAAIAHPTQLPEPEETIRYKTPLSLAMSPDGGELYVTCEASDSVIVVDADRRRRIGEIAVGGQPNGVAFHPNGRWAYVSNRLDDSVSVIDVAARSPINTMLPIRSFR